MIIEGINIILWIYRIWKFQLPPIESSNKSYNIIITNLRNSQTIQLKDVLFGDVYVCSGQSNMEQAVLIYYLVIIIIIIVVLHR